MPSSGQLLQWIVVSMLALAVLMVHSARADVADPEPLLVQIATSRTLLYAGLAMAAMVVAGRLDLRGIYRTRGVANPILWMLLAAIVLCALVLVPGIGKTVNGASRWLHVGLGAWSFTFQPSELAKWAIVAGFAWWGARRAGSMHRFGAGLLPPLAVLAVVCGLVVGEDFGTALLIGAVGVFLLLAAGARWWHLALLAPPALAAVAWQVVSSPYRMERLTAFFRPWENPKGAGYHAIQSMVAIAGGDLTGWGLGNGLQKRGFLPEDQTDFLLAIICEELGAAGAVLVIAMYLGLLWVGLSIVRDCAHRFGRLLGIGVLVMIGAQALMNIAVVTVTVPTKGIALPLLSAGGTGWVMGAGAIGLLVALDRINQMEAEPAAATDAPTPSISASAAQ